MKGRPRIDLDSVVLSDADADTGAALAIFRYRTTDGLVLMVPESADFLVPWDALTEARIALGSGLVHVAFTEDYAAAHNWLRGARQLVGAWTDRYEMAPP